MANPRPMVVKQPARSWRAWRRLDSIECPRHSPLERCVASGHSLESRPAQFWLTPGVRCDSLGRTPTHAPSLCSSPYKSCSKNWRSSAARGRRFLTPTLQVACFRQVQRDMPHDGEALCCIAGTDATVVLTKRNIEHPVQLVLDPPMAPYDRLRRLCSQAFLRRDVVALLGAHLAIDRSVHLDKNGAREERCHQRRRVCDWPQVQSSRGRDSLCAHRRRRGLPLRLEEHELAATHFDLAHCVKPNSHLTTRRCKAGLLDVDTNKLAPWVYAEPDCR
jgi:hypothetical protein